jgi:hypothetical protein
MKKNLALSIACISAILLFVACSSNGDSPAQPASTAVGIEPSQSVQPTATPEPPTQPEPTATPEPTLAPTAIPSATPTLTPSPTNTPAPEKAELKGNLQINLIPFGEGAEVPETLGDILITFKNLDTEEETLTQVVGPDGEYSFALLSGSYKLLNITIESLNVELLTGVPTVTVPESGCIFIGNLILSYYRLPPLPFMEQISLAQEANGGEDLLFTYYEDGGFVPESTSIDVPESYPDSCDIQLLSFETP